MRHTFVRLPLWYLLNMVRVNFRIIFIYKFPSSLLRGAILGDNIVARVFLNVHRHFRKPIIRWFGSFRVSGRGRPLPLLLVEPKSWVINVLVAFVLDISVFDDVTVQIRWKFLLVVLNQVFHIESRFGKLWFFCLWVRHIVHGKRVRSVKYWVWFLI